MKKTAKKTVKRKHVKKKIVKTEKKMSPRLDTGIPALNKVLEGGYIRGSSVLLMAPPRMGKSIFATHFITAENDDIGVYVATNDLGSDVMKRVKSFNSSFSNAHVIDAYSSEARKQGKGVINVGKSNLSDISVALSEIFHSYPGRTVRCTIDSVSNLLLHNTLSEVANFLEDVVAKFRAHDGVVILIIEKGMHDESVYVMLESQTDSTVELEEKSDGTFIRLSGFDVSIEKVLEYIPYKIVKGRIELR